jgi:hypothetical protein
MTAGSMLSELVPNLVDALPVDAYPEEDSAAVVVEMLCGTIATALASVEPREVTRATELIDLARPRTLEHLPVARELSRRMESGNVGVGRTYD